MPLKLLERVLPWFVSKLDDEDAQSFLQNMCLAGYLSYFKFTICSMPLYHTSPLKHLQILIFTNCMEQHLLLKLHWLLFSLVGHAKVV